MPKCDRITIEFNDDGTYQVTACYKNKSGTEMFNDYKDYSFSMKSLSELEDKLEKVSEKASDEMGKGKKKKSKKDNSLKAFMDD